MLCQTAELGICSSVFRGNRSSFAQKWANEWFAQKIRSFFVSDLSDSLTIAHFLWAKFFLRIAHSLISSERPEWFAHSRSFVLSDLSESLTVAYLIWAKWANEQWANSQPCQTVVGSQFQNFIFLQLPLSLVSGPLKIWTHTIKWANRLFFI